jgi:hypothetical protein
MFVMAQVLGLGPPGGREALSGVTVQSVLIPTISMDNDFNHF